MYLPRESTKYVYLDAIVRKINSNSSIVDEIKYKFARDYNNFANKTDIKYSRQDYKKFVINPIKEYYDEDTRDER